MAVTRFVLDASIVVKWFIEEEHSEKARLFMSAQRGIVRSPDFLLVEAANAFVSSARGGRIQEAEIAENLELIPEHLQLIPSAPLRTQAAVLALDHGRSVYDCLYLALAIREGCRLLTADERFYNALRQPFAAQLLWIADVPST